MLDSQIKQQLEGAFQQLENEISLVYKPSSHKDQSQLLEMLNDIQSTSSKILVKPAISDTLKYFESIVDTTPEFYIEYKGKPNGIYFKGIPGGHEFTSLIISILNSDQKGKLPDKHLISRIQNLKGPIEIKTFISLTCENCPDVVQALNQMAILHPDFKHQMIDGAYTQDQIEKLGIQGVPSIVVNNKMIHSGRINFIDLLSLLEKTFETQPKKLKTEPEHLGLFDVVVVGGGPAGASAAIYSARKGLKTALVAERIGGQVQETKGIENLISVPYTEGPQLAGHLAQHISLYPIKIFEHRRVAEIFNDKNDTTKKKITFEDQDFLESKAIIMATGARWRELGIPGEKEYIGRGVAFCPHCDGPFYKGKKVAVIGGGNSGVEAAIDLAGIVGSVVLFEFQEQLKADSVLVEKLKKLSNVSILTSARTVNIIGDGQKVKALEFEDRKTQNLNTLELDGIFVQIGLLPNNQPVKNLVELNKFGEIVIDNKCRTTTPGIYAAGDVTTVPYKQIIISMGEGAKAALAAFEDLTFK